MEEARYHEVVCECSVLLVCPCGSPPDGKHKGHSHTHQAHWKLPAVVIILVTSLMLHCFKLP